MTDPLKQPSTVSAVTPAAVPAAVPAAMNQDVLLSLVQLLLAERQDAILEKQEKLRAREAREQQRRLNAEYNEAEVKEKQRVCTHKKGGTRGPKSTKLDYAVYFHTCTDGSSYIRCLICGAKWKSTDTREYLIRRGEKVENHTGIGWVEAHQMLAQSTNSPSASEVNFNTSPIVNRPVDFKTNPHAVEV